MPLLPPTSKQLSSPFSFPFHSLLLLLLLSFLLLFPSLSNVLPVYLFIITSLYFLPSISSHFSSFLYSLFLPFLPFPPSLKVNPPLYCSPSLLLPPFLFPPFLLPSLLPYTRGHTHEGKRKAITKARLMRLSRCYLCSFLPEPILNNHVVVNMFPILPKLTRAYLLLTSVLHGGARVDSAACKMLIEK